MGGAPLPVREHASVADMMAHYRAVHARCFQARPRAASASTPVPAPVAPEADIVAQAREAYAPLPGTIHPARLARGATVRAHDVLSIVAGVTGVSVPALCGPRRGMPEAKARQIAYWLLMQHAGVTLPHAGHILGGRDHTSVLHGIRRVDTVIAALSLHPPSDDLAGAARLLWDAPWPGGCGRRRHP